MSRIRRLRMRHPRRGSLLQTRQLWGIVYKTIILQRALEEPLPRGGTPPLVPMWPGVRVTEQNPFPFFPFDPRWREGFSKPDFQTFCALLRLAWVSPRPCFLSTNIELLNRTLVRIGHTPASPRVLAQFSRHPRTGLLYFPSQLRALERLVSGEDLYALLWDEEL